MSFVITASRSARACARQSASTSAVLPEPTGPPMPILRGFGITSGRAARRAAHGASRRSRAPGVKRQASSSERSARGRSRAARAIGPQRGEDALALELPQRQEAQGRAHDHDRRGRIADRPAAASSSPTPSGRRGERRRRARGGRACRAASTASKSRATAASGVQPRGRRAGSGGPSAGSPRAARAAGFIASSARRSRARARGRSPRARAPPADDGHGVARPGAPLQEHAQERRARRAASRTCPSCTQVSRPKECAYATGREETVGELQQADEGVSVHARRRDRARAHGGLVAVARPDRREDGLACARRRRRVAREAAPSP